MRPGGLETIRERARLLLSGVRREAAVSRVSRRAVGLLVVAFAVLVPIYYVYVDLHSAKRADVTRPSVTSPERAGESVGVTPGQPVDAQEVVPGPRIADVRPIKKTPPDPRDTTSAIRNEALDVQERTARRDANGPAASKAAAGDQSGGGSSAETSRSGGIAAADGSANRSADNSVSGKVIGSPAPPSGTAANAASDIDGTIQARFAATRDWLAAAPDGTNTVQILGVGTEERLKVELQTLFKALDADNVYVFRTLANRKPWFTVAYGSYPDRRAAVQAIQTLPRSVAANQPYVRTMTSIRNELAQYGITQ